MHANAATNIRTAVDAHAGAHQDLGGVNLNAALNNEEMLTDAQALDIRNFAIKKLNQLKVIHAIEQIDGNPTDAQITALRAVYDAGGTLVAIKTAIFANTAANALNLQLVGAQAADADWLKGPDVVNSAVSAKLQTIYAAKITAAVAALNVGGNVTAFTALVSADREDAIRTVLTQNLAPLGGIDLGASPNELLCDNDALAIRKTAINRFIRHKLEQVTFVHLAELTALADAAAAGVDTRHQAIRDVLGNDTFFVDQLLLGDDDTYLSDQHADDIQNLAKTKRKALIAEHIKELIQAMPNPPVSPALEALASAGLPVQAGADQAQAANAIRTVLNDQAHRAAFENLITHGHVDNEDLLTNEEAIAIRKLAINRLIILSIGADRTIGNYKESLAENAQSDEIKTYLKTHLKTALNITDNKLDVLDDEQLAAIRDRIIQKKSELQDELYQDRLRAITSMPTPWAWNLISRLPPDDKKVLFEDKHGLYAFLTAKTPFEIAQVCRLFGWNASTSLEATQKPVKLEILSYQVMCENRARRALLQLQHATIAEFAAEKGLMLTPVGIQQLNNKICGYGAQIPFHQDQTPTFLATLFNGVEIFDADTGSTRVLRGDEIVIPTDPAFLREINDQFRSNEYIYAQLSHGRHGDKAAWGLLARIPKKESVAPLSVAQITALTNAIKTADTYAHLMVLLATNTAPHNLNTIVDTHFEHYKAVITEEAFQYVKSQYQRDEFIGSASYDDQIKEQAKTIKDLKDNFEAFTEADKAISGEMERLSNVTGYAWLNPEAEGLARRYAEKFLGDFEQIGDMCDSVCRGLIEQRLAYQALLESMPRDGDIERLDKKLIGGQQTAVKDHIKKIKKEIKILDEASARYNDLHRRLYGNPYQETGRDKIQTIAQKGILSIMRDAKNTKLADDEKAALHFKSFPLRDKTTTYESYQKNRVEPVSYDRGKTTMHANGTSSEVSQIFKNKGAIEPGQFHLYEVSGLYDDATPSTPAQTPSPKPLISESAYTEEQAPLSPSEQKKGASLPILFTVVKYPQAVKGPTLTADQQTTLAEMKVEFVTKMAATLLARMGRLPTKDDPIVIVGSNEEEVGMLWTALALLGENDSRWKFNADAIMVRSAHFNPSTQKNFLGNYKSGSYHDTFFKSPNGHYLREVKKGLKGFYEDSFGTKDTQKMSQKTLEATSMFRAKLQEVAVKEGVSAIAPKSTRGTDPG